MDWCAPRVIPTPKSWLPTISTRRAYWVLLSPKPPRSCGTCKPNAPNSHRPSKECGSTASMASFTAGLFTSCRKHHNVNNLTIKFQVLSELWSSGGKLVPEIHLKSICNLTSTHSPPHNVSYKYCCGTRLENVP